MPSVQITPEAGARAAAKPARWVDWGLYDMLRAVLAAAGLIALGTGVLLLLARLGGVPLGSTRRALLILVLESVLLIPAWYWGPHRYGGGWASLGLRRCPWWKVLALGVVAAMVVAVASVWWDGLRRAWSLRSQPSLWPLLAPKLPSLLVTLLVVAVLCPVIEEVFFRGFLFAGLRARLGWGGALVISAALFSVAHVVPGIYPQIFLVGLLLGLLYEFTSSVWPCIAMHGLLNAMAVIAGFVAMQYVAL